MHWNGSWWHAGGMWLFWLAVFVMIGLAISFAIRVLQKSEPPDESPREILRKRFARGEIDKEEYERMIENLRQS